MKGKPLTIARMKRRVPPQIKGKIEHFISRKGDGYRWIWDRKPWICSIVWDLIHNTADLYELTAR